MGHIPKKDFRKIKGIIVYSYDPTGEYVEPAQVKQQYLDILPENFSQANIEIILTNSEVYSLAGLNLYLNKELSGADELIISGSKSDFKLYGLFMGEILYHRVVSVVNKIRKEKVKKKRDYLIKNFVILFFAFTALSIGGNALYAILFDKLKSNSFLLFTSIVFSLLLPVFILIVKPKLLIDVDDE